MKNIKIISTILLILTLSCAVFAQKMDFKKIDCIGKPIMECLPIIQQLMRYSVGTFEDKTCINRYSTDYGIVGFIFNKKDICTGIILPTESKRVYNLIAYKKRILKYNMTIIEL